MSNKLLLTEFIELTPNRDLLTEEEKKRMDEGEEIYLAGVMQRAGATNGNGRVYPLDILKREVENYKKIVREGRSVGELDHPESSVVELKNTSHIVTEIDMDGNDVIGKIKLLETAAGKTAIELLRGGVKLGISSRGLGSTRNEGSKTIVEDDFQLICFDLVSEPSTTGAFMLREGKEPNIFTKADKINRILNDILSHEK
tara:strand:+ start:2861 stop:3460 length:600 start_codon:yes stop_codon:yes gene_type:complete